MNTGKINLNTERISQYSHRIFNSSLTEKQVGRTSNPFAKPMFSENVLKADVFDSSIVEAKGSKLTQMKNSVKRTFSTFVASINDLGSKINEGLDAIREFGHKIKENIVSAWDKAREIGNTEIHPTEIFKGMIHSISHGNKQKELNELKEKSAAELSEIFVSRLKDLENSLTNETEQIGQHLSAAA